LCSRFLPLRIFLLAVQSFQTALDISLMAAGRFVLRALEFGVFDVDGAEFAPVFGLS
jgi:hypothetical protein